MFLAVPQSLADDTSSHQCLREHCFKKLTTVFCFFAEKNEVDGAGLGPTTILCSLSNEE
jgi:hypothetical protein